MPASRYDPVGAVCVRPAFLAIGAARLPAAGARAAMKRLLRGVAVRRALAWLLGVYLGVALRTTRWTVQGEGHLAPFLADGPLIVAVWHERLALMPALWLRARRRTEVRGRRVFLLVSRHRDGQLLGTILRRFGLGVVLGSSTRGAVAGLKGSLDRLAGGAVVGITPDGPQGPARVCAPGVAALAALAGAPVLPCAAQIGWRVTLRSWDRMVLPLPFGRGVVVCGPPIAVPRAGWQACLPAIGAALDAAAAEADRAVG
jgi:lysophospholipid acyltransferase (LPLAT)-like uncharacterized protein